MLYGLEIVNFAGITTITQQRSACNRCQSACNRCQSVWNPWEYPKEKASLQDYLGLWLWLSFGGVYCTLPYDTCRLSNKIYCVSHPQHVMIPRWTSFLWRYISIQRFSGLFLWSCILPLRLYLLSSEALLTLRASASFLWSCISTQRFFQSFIWSSLQLTVSLVALLKELQLTGIYTLLIVRLPSTFFNKKPNQLWFFSSVFGRLNTSVACTTW